MILRMSVRMGGSMRRRMMGSVLFGGWNTAAWLL